VKQLLLALIIAFVSAVSAETAEQELLGLSYEEFDQDADGGWRLLARERKCSQAARLIERYAAARSDELDAYKKSSLAFHAAQMYGMANFRTEAIRKLEETRSLFPSGPNEGYVLGLLSYWKKDLAALASAKALVQKLPDTNPAKATQLKSVEALIAYQDCPFAVIGKPRPTPNACPIDPEPCE
jgi:hypothetical protein